MNYLDIINAFRNDPGKGLELLFQQYGQLLYGYSVNRWQLSEDEGYDVLYKTLEIVSKVIGRYEFTSAEHFRNWIFKIHKNNMLQLLRTKKRQEQFNTVSFQDWKAEAEADADDESQLEELRAVVEKIAVVNPYDNNPASNHLMVSLQKALQQLNETDREILLLRMNNYSYDEIAGMLGIENNQLKVKFNRAKAKAKKLTLTILKDNYNETL